MVIFMIPEYNQNITMSVTVMKSIIVRNIDNDILKALKNEQDKSGRSLNSIILDKLKIALNLKYEKKRFYNTDLDDLAGTWTEKDEKDFVENTKAFGVIEDSSISNGTRTCSLQF